MRKAEGGQQCVGGEKEKRGAVVRGCCEQRRASGWKDLQDRLRV